MYDLSYLIKITRGIQNSCNICKLDYTNCEDVCIFCKNFNPCRDNHITIIKEMYWLYIKSGEDYKVFCTNYIENMQRWCNKFKIIPNEYDIRYITYENSLIDS